MSNLFSINILILYIKQFFCVLIVFFFIYAQVFSFLPLSASKIIVTSLVINYIFIKDFFVHYKFYVSSLRLLIIGITSFFYFLLVIIANQSNDYTFLYNIFLVYFEFCFGSFLIINLIREKFKFSEIQTFKIIAFAIFLQSLFIIGSLLSPILNSTLNTLLPKIGNIDDETLIAFRGFSNSAGANLSVIQSIGVWLSLMLLIVSNNWKSKIISFLYFFFCIASTVLVGRTGLIMSLFFFICMFFYSLFIKSSSRSSVLLLLVVSIFSLCAIYMALPELYQEHLQENIFPRAFEVFYSFGETGKFTSESTEDISNNMLFLPDNFFSLIFGDGYYVDGQGNYKGTDSGYIREIFMGGIFGLIIINLIYWFSLNSIFKMVKKRYHHSIQLLMTSLIFCILLIELKEPFLLKVGLPSIIFLFFFNFLSTDIKFPDINYNNEKN